MNWKTIISALCFATAPSIAIWGCLIAALNRHRFVFLCFLILSIIMCWLCIPLLNQMSRENHVRG